MECEENEFSVEKLACFGAVEEGFWYCAYIYLNQGSQPLTLKRHLVQLLTDKKNLREPQSSTSLLGKYTLFIFMWPVSHSFM